MNHFAADGRYIVIFCRNIRINQLGKVNNMTLTEEIEQLKSEKNAVILAHYYVRPEVQQVADYIGDSFYLSKVAAGLKQKTIVFCGVSFMGESAKILSPDKRVLMPDLTADCPMAHMADAETIAEMREKYEDLAVVCYINSTSELKMHSDVCVTSANAVEIVKALPNQNIFFIPDKNLAHFVAEQAPEKHFVFHTGYCPTHEHMKCEEVKALKAAHPDAKVLAHPECSEAVRAAADYLGSTSGIIQYATKDEGQEFIICTEEGVNYELQKKNPGKRFYYPDTAPVCPDMKKNTLEKLRDALREGENEVQVSGEVRRLSRLSLEKMHELAGA